MDSLPKAKVAIVTRTKNRPILLRRALDSILSQTYSDYVVIVVNDAGERAPVEECVASVAERANDRIHIVHNERSDGREAAMNTGLRHSDSEYVVIHDDDDTWAPGFLTATVGRLENSADGGVAVRTSVVMERIDGEQIIEDSEEILASNMHDVTLFEVMRRNYVPPISLLYRRSIHEAVGEYAAELPVLADWDFLLRILREFTVGFIDGEPLAFWHHRAGQAGDLGNSVIANADEHRGYDRVIRDHYLRKDLSENGGFGTLLYLTEIIDRAEQLERDRYDSVQIVLQHINKCVSDLSASFDSRLHEANQLHSDSTGKVNQTRIALHAVNSSLTELNRNLIGQNNRLVAQMESLNSRVVDVEHLVFSQTPRERLKSWKSLARRKGGAIARRFR